MTEPKKPSQGTSPKPTPEPAKTDTAPRKSRRHGYRGYPLSKGAGGVHWGRGFSGVEPLGGGTGTLPRAGILTEESTRHTKE